MFLRNDFEKLQPTMAIQSAPHDVAQEYKYRKEIENAHFTRCYLQVDLSALRHNIDIMRAQSGGARIMAVIKGNAYGMGAKDIGRALQNHGVEAFAVDNTAEAIELRMYGINKPILILDGDVFENIDLVIKYGFIPGVAHVKLLEAYEKCASNNNVIQPIWIYYNAGFNRSGYSDIADFERFVKIARECKHLKICAIYSHLTDSNASEVVSRKQIDMFLAASRIAKSVLGEHIETSLFASHGIVRWAGEIHTDWVRPGVMLYGANLFINEDLQKQDLSAISAYLPAITLKARVIHLITFNGVENVGYGTRHKTHAGQKIATVALGYGTGYPNGAAKLPAIINGTCVSLFGAVGMDYLQLDVTAVPRIELDDWITLIGTDGGAQITIKQLADAAQTTPYVLLRRLNVARRYIG
jgi:alanine racemase